MKWSFSNSSISICLPAFYRISRTFTKSANPLSIVIALEEVPIVLVARGLEVVGCGSTVGTDIKEAEGRCIARATKGDYIHSQMSKQVTNRVT